MGWQCLDRVNGPDGLEFALYRFDDQFMIRVGGHELMTTRAHGSEEALARLACRELGAKQEVRVLVGGLGLGYTLAEALRRLPAAADIEVCELIPAVVGWSRTVTGACCGWPLRDPRVQVSIADVGEILAARKAYYDAVLLDVDNGPEALACAANDALYGELGIGRVKAALRAGGVFTIWAAEPDPKFEGRLVQVGFHFRRLQVPARGPGDSLRHTIYLARVEAY